ncbi:MAG: LptF/LptG family permease [Actinobacteria bacterium]|nr:LptF/LptG family permease [Actinomycetota bacterium]
MRILDRERYWSYLKAYVICFTALVGLYIVIDAFSNFDEFTKRASGVVEIFAIMGRFYLVHLAEMYDRLCGVIGMMAAIFTVTWMQKNNELLAMLAAGISTQRVIRPVIYSSMIVSLLAVANQELIMPKYAEELLRRHDDDGVSTIKRITGRYDVNGIYIHGNEADRTTQTVLSFNATFPKEIFGNLMNLEARQARYIPLSDRTSPYRGGWLIRGAALKPPLPPERELTEPRVLLKLDNDQGFPPPSGDVKGFTGETYFLRTPLSFAAVTRPRQWYQYAPTAELIRGLTDPANGPEKMDIAVFLHNRLLRPLISLALLLLSLPQVLGGYGRNMFVGLGISLGTAAVFYAVNFVSQYLGAHEVMSPELAAWAPLIGFGTIAVARWDTIRT